MIKNYPKVNRVHRRIQISANVDENLWSIAKDNHIGWSEALEFGIRFLHADKNEIDYPNCNLLNKKIELAKKFAEELAKNEGERKKIVAIIDAEKEAEEVFDELKNAEIK